MTRSNPSIPTDDSASTDGRTLIDIYGPIMPELVDEPHEWDPALVPEGFYPEETGDGRPFRTAAWDGGFSDLEVARDLYDTTEGAPATVVYANHQDGAGAVAFTGIITDYTGHALTIEQDDGTTRAIYHVDPKGREDVVHSTDDRYMGDLCEIRLAPTREALATEQAASDRIAQEGDADA